MRRKLRLAEDPEQQIARSFSLEEAQRFIEALRHEPEHALLLKTMAYTGLRIGETLGLAWGDIDWIAGRFTVARSWQRGKLVNTKTRQQRSVDIPEALLEELRQHDAATKATALAHGESRSPQLFHNDSAVNVRAAFQRVLRKAGLPVHFTPHGLRHTYARLQLEGGASLKYVQQQLGHRTISITADLYGRHADLGSRATADALVARLSPRSADRRIPEQGQER
jgi:integrase